MIYRLARMAGEMEEAGRRVIRLNIGHTNLPTPPAAVEAAVKSLQDKKADYVSAAGITAFRQAVASVEGCAPEQVVAGSGSKQLIYGLIESLTEPGDKVVFPSPYWPAYRMICQRLGREPVVVRTTMDNRWQFDSLPLEDAAMVILCNPSNPTSVVYDKDLIKRTIVKAREAGVPVLLDEAYKGLAFESVPRFEGCIRVKSFSKEFAMEGWRLGYVVAPVDVVEKLRKFNQLTNTCVPEFIQRGGIAVLAQKDEILENSRKIWLERYRMSAPMVRQAGFSFVEPGGGIYLFAAHPKIKNSGEFALSLLQQGGVAVTPGSSFGDHEGFVRITLCQEVRVLQKALKIITRHLK